MNINDEVRRITKHEHEIEVREWIIVVLAMIAAILMAAVIILTAPEKDELQAYNEMVERQQTESVWIRGANGQIRLE